MPELRKLQYNCKLVARISTGAKRQSHNPSVKGASSVAIVLQDRICDVNVHFEMQKFYCFIVLY